MSYVQFLDIGSDVIYFFPKIIFKSLLKEINMGKYYTVDQLCHLCLHCITIIQGAHIDLSVFVNLKQKIKQPVFVKLLEFIFKSFLVNDRFVLLGCVYFDFNYVFIKSYFYMFRSKYLDFSFVLFLQKCLLIKIPIVETNTYNNIIILTTILLNEVGKECVIPCASSDFPFRLHIRIRRIKLLFSYLQIFSQVQYPKFFRYPIKM